MSQFVQKDWRDAWDLESGGWKTGSWYPGRNLSRFFDKNVGAGDYHKTYDKYGIPGDYNPFLDDMSLPLGTHVESSRGKNLSEEITGDELTGYDKSTWGHSKVYPSEEGQSKLKTLFPEEEGAAYGQEWGGTGQKSLDPYTGGFVTTGHDYRYPLDTSGQRVTTHPDQYGTSGVETDRWYPGKGIKNIWGMVTGQKDWSNPFGNIERFTTDEYGHPGLGLKYEDTQQYRTDSPYYQFDESGNVNYPQFYKNVESEIGNRGLLKYTE